jgi:hypothetical protein
MIELALLGRMIGVNVLCHYYSSLHFNREEQHKNKITEKYTFTRNTTFILGNPLGEENPAKTSLS